MLVGSWASVGRYRRRGRDLSPSFCLRVFGGVRGANKNINIYSNATNILNIRDNNLKNNFIQSDVLIQETIMNTLSGFFNFGVNYSF